MSNHNPWPTLLREYRKRQGLKQEALAYLLGVHQSSVSRWESGGDVPSIGQQKRLRDMLRQELAVDPVVTLLRHSSQPMSLVRPVRSMPRYAMVSPGTARLHGTTPEQMQHMVATTVWTATGSHYRDLAEASRGVAMGEFAHASLRAGFVTAEGKRGIYIGDWVPANLNGERMLLTSFRFMALADDADDSGTFVSVTAHDDLLI
jgi:DNA-binding XRE family transcriptional regulator